MTADLSSPRPPAFIHADLDGLWTLAGVYGFEEGSTFADDPVFDLALPRMLDLLGRRGILAGLFIVGRDLDLEPKRAVIAAAIRAGHEPANHSHHHWVGLERRGPEAVRGEIARAQAAITAACGVAPVGFRAPGYDAGPNVLAALGALGLRYDGSLLPTPWAPLLRLAANRLRRAVARDSGRVADLAPFAGQYGGGCCAAGSHTPDAGASTVLRFPLAVSPVLRLPVHASLGVLIGEARVASAWRRILSRRAAVPPTFLLHGLDFLDPSEFADRLPRALASSRAFQVPLARKLALVNRVLDVIQSLATPALARDFASPAGEGVRA